MGWDHYASAAWLTGNRAVADFQGRVQDLEALVQLLLCDAQGWIGHDRVPPNEGEEARIEQGLPDRLHLWRRAVERGQGFERLPVSHELQGSEQTNRSHRAHKIGR